MSGKTRASVVAKVAELTSLREHSAGRVADSTNITVAAWVDRWLRGVEDSGASYRTVQTYQSLMNVHVIPVIGSIRLDRLTVLHVDDLISSVRTKSGPTVASNTRRTLAVCLNAARKKRLVAVAATSGSNPVIVPESPVKALTVEDHRRVLVEVSKDRLAARWLIALSGGPRQSEVLGFTWRQVRETPKRTTILIDRQLQRHPYRHGCPEPNLCGKKPRSCPQRIGGLTLVMHTKGRRPRQLTLLPGEAGALKAWRTTQKAEFLAGGYTWSLDTAVFTQEHTNKPLTPKMDWLLWGRLLDRCGVEHVGVHGMRHTAATRLLEAGVESRVIADLLGWAPSTTGAMLARYAHVSEDTQADALAAAAARL